MIAIYFMSTKDIAICSREGNVLFYTTDPIYEVIKKYNIDDLDVHIVI